MCVRYRLDGGETENFPFPAALAQAGPVIEYLDGWGSDISGARAWEELPRQAKDYVEYIEGAVGCPVGRCPEQVDAFLRKVRPLLEGVSIASDDIEP